MKNIDNDIEQFEKNLIEIDSMRGEISKLKDSLDNMLKETKDIDEIKNKISKEIESIQKSNESLFKQINEVSLKQSKYNSIIIALLVLSFIIGIIDLISK